ncbi:MAG: TetR/AcrR family transcriptional regulator [Chloroflexi bacterium]|nr:TetR/AcrR family transcriptional regulator [Chloroflexota bacterium]
MTENDFNRRQQILNAAVKVFARVGFAGATIKKIADEAGLKSPALIYWYFPNKQALFVAVVTELSPLLQRIAGDNRDLMAEPPQDVLLYFAQSAIAYVEHPGAGNLMRILFSEINQIEELMESYATLQKMILGFLTAYLQQQIAAGRLKPHDPQVSARMFIGALLTYALSRHVFTWLAEGLPPGTEYAEQLVAHFLHGLQA